MNIYYKYFLSLLLCITTFACSKNPDDDSCADNQEVYFAFAPNYATQSKMLPGDKFVVTPLYINDPLTSSYTCFGIYEVQPSGEIKHIYDEDYKNEKGEFVAGKIKPLVLISNTYYIMAAGYTKETLEGSEKKHEFGLPEANTEMKCRYYTVNRKGYDENDVKDFSVAIAPYTVGVHNNSAKYNIPHETYQYIFNADLELKEQISKIRFTLQSNNYDPNDEGAGHSIKSIYFKNLLNTIDLCPIHGYHVSSDNVDKTKHELLYDGAKDLDGNIRVNEKKYLTGDDVYGTDGYINLVAGDYTATDATLSTLLPTPKIEVVYPGSPTTNNKDVISELLVKSVFEPMTKYSFDITLTRTQIDVHIMKIATWDSNGNTHYFTAQEVTSYSIPYQPGGWYDGGDINGDI